MKKHRVGLFAFTLTCVAALISSAYAADLGGFGGLKDEPLPAGWAGLYAGVHVGAVWGRDDVSPTRFDGGQFPRTSRLDANTDAFGGGTLGYNFQRGNFVFGVEVDGGPMEISKSRVDTPTAPNEIDHINKGLYADVTGRLGYTFGAGLVYGKGGFAVYDGEGIVNTISGPFTSKATDTFTGWTAGGGAEYKINPAVSVKVEYLHFDFGSQNSTITTNGSGTVFPFKHELTADTVKVGVNYHWLPAYEPLK
jgi:outer membrane immunogenic protein